MKRYSTFTYILLAMTLLITFLECNSVPASRQLEIGQTMPEIRLKTPNNLQWQKYLGITTGSTFSIADIPADLIVIQIFSMYCPYCQKEAPNVNHLYELIERNSKAKNHIKLLGIGASNSPFEVQVFQQQYKVPFPLFPDPDLTIHKKVGSVRTPCFFVVNRRSDGLVKLVYSKVGGLGDPKVFLHKLLGMMRQPSRQ